MFFEELKEYVNTQIKDMIVGTPKNIGETDFLEKASIWWNLKKDFKSFADPDAARLIPKMDIFFENKREEIIEMGYDTEFTEKLLKRLSGLRKEMGFDKRYREIKGKNH